MRHSRNGRTRADGKTVPDENPLEQEAITEGLTAAAERQTLFTDAVIAIAITLLALDLPIPGGRTNSQFLHSAWHDRSDYISFLISFMVIGVHWRSHHGVFRYVIRSDTTLGQLNLTWVFLQVITPFAAKILSGDHAFQVRFGFYALVQFLASAVFVMMVGYLQRTSLCRPGTPDRVLQYMKVQNFIMAGLFLLSIPVSFVTHWSYVCWALGPVIASLSHFQPGCKGGGLVAEGCTTQ